MFFFYLHKFTAAEPLSNPSAEILQNHCQKTTRRLHMAVSLFGVRAELPGLQESVNMALVNKCDSKEKKNESFGSLSSLKEYKLHTHNKFVVTEYRLSEVNIKCHS